MSHNVRKVAVIIGAGPAGLTAAYELLERTDVHPIVIERDPRYVGGISRTVDHEGNKIDIGGHRFFSKSDRVMRWWADMLPVRLDSGAQVDLTYQRTTKALTEGLSRAIDADGDMVMQVRPRKTRILYGGDFYAYPVEVSLDTIRKLGLIKMMKIGVTYIRSALFPRKPERTLEDFFINRFGTELYKTFFKSYTEKVWGVACSELSAEWGAQRVKGLSIRKALAHALKKVLSIGPLSGKSVETSLIEQFLYPTYGPGLMWETVVKKIQERGGEVRMGVDVVGIELDKNAVVAVVVRSDAGEERIAADHVFSTTDVRSLARMIRPLPPSEVLEVSDGLEYRDFLTVGILLDTPPHEKSGERILDTWMYVHEPGVCVGRIQFFHNWNPALLADPARGWIGLEYFCSETDALWNMSDEALGALGTKEFSQLGLGGDAKVLSAVVVRQPKAYPGYFGSYAQFDVIRRYFDGIADLYLIGRNGMHRYNNQDHSMLSAMAAVDVLTGTGEKRMIWEVNTGEEYHEKK